MQNTLTRAEKIIFWGMSFWIMGFYLMPFSRQHYQLFLFTIVLSALWLIFSLRIDYKSLLKSRIIQVSLVYAGLFFISIFWSNQPDWSDRTKEIKTFLYLLFFGMVFLYVLDGKTARLAYLIQFVLGAAVLSLIINFYYFYGYQEQLVTARFAGLGRLWNPLWAAAMYGAAALVVLAILLDKYQHMKTVTRLGLLAAYALMILAVFLTQSRTPTAAVVLMSVVAVIFSKYSLQIKVRLVGSVSVVCLVILALYFPDIQEYLEARGQSYRLDLWLGFWEQTKDRWLFGNGGGSNVVIDAPGKLVDNWYHYHSIYIGSLVELGVVGLILHLIIILITLHKALKLKEYFHVRVASLIFMYACIIGLTFAHGIMTRMHTQWLLFWMPLLVIAMYELKAQQLSVRSNKSLKKA